MASERPVLPAVPGPRARARAGTRPRARARPAARPDVGHRRCVARPHRVDDVDAIRDIRVERPALLAVPHAGDDGRLPLVAEPRLDVVPGRELGLDRGRRRRFGPLGVKTSSPRHEHVLVRQERDEVRVRHLRRARGHAEARSAARPRTPRPCRSARRPGSPQTTSFTVTFRRPRAGSGSSSSAQALIRARASRFSESRRRFSATFLRGRREPSKVAIYLVQIPCVPKDASMASGSGYMLIFVQCTCR